MMAPFLMAQRRRSLARLLGWMALAALPGMSFAQPDAYPAKPIRLIVGYPAGGASDVAARIVGQKLSERMGQSIVVDNRPGSAGNIGADAVAKANPDGYTLLFGTISLAVNPSLYPKMSYDPLKDLRAVSMISSTPFLLVTNPASPYDSVKALLDDAKRNPGAINYATAGNGSGSHLFTALLVKTAGIQLTHVPYKGAAPAMNDVLGNQIPVTFDNIMTTLSLVKAGKLRALAVSTRERSSVAPNVPTLDESGVKGFDATAWFGLFAPTGTSDAIVDRLNKELAKVLNDPPVMARLNELGAQPWHASPAASATFFKSEASKWREVVRDARIQVD